MWIHRMSADIKNGKRNIIYVEAHPKHPEGSNFEYIKHIYCKRSLNEFDIELTRKNAIQWKKHF